MVRDSILGHQLLLPPTDWCPLFASRTTQAAKLEALKSKEQHQGGPVVKPWHKKAKAASTQANNKLETVETDACANAADAVGAGIG